MTAVVVDSTCLIGLERINALHILKGSFQSILIPDAVKVEWDRDAPWIVIAHAENTDLVTALSTQVDRGEAEVITLALEREALVLLDDKKARALARKLGLRVVGSEGLTPAAARCRPPRSRRRRRLW